jgi:hypothetical protein
MLALFTLYLQDKAEGFGWTDAQATTLARELPALRLLLADLRRLDRGPPPRLPPHGPDRRLLLHRRTRPARVPVDPGRLRRARLPRDRERLFKPNVSTIVGNLYPKGSHLRDRAYNIFYMGINTGATAGRSSSSSCTATTASTRPSPWPRSAWRSRSSRSSSSRRTSSRATATRGGARRTSRTRARRPRWTRCAGAADHRADRHLRDLDRLLDALLPERVDLTYFANDNTDWEFSGIISNAIEPFFVIAFSLPLVWLWKRLDEKGKEPSTTTKIAIGMFLIAIAYYVMYFAGKAGGDTGKVSPAWIVSFYALVGLAEITLSPMALSLVSKVAPKNVRGLMMGSGSSRRDRRQADPDRRLLDGVEALHVLRRARHDVARDGARRSSWCSSRSSGRCPGS